MKGSITISDMIGIVGIIIAVMVFVTQIMPTLLSVIIDTFSKTSAENVARQLSNLITVSGAAPHRAEINYEMKAHLLSSYKSSSEVLYQVSIKSKTIKVTPEFKVAYAEKSSSIQPFAVSLADKDFKDVNSFFIEKNFLNGESSYAFDAKKE